MTSNESYTFATRSGRRGATFGIVALLLSGFLLRSGRLSWQPLWWDEGYSVYFATETLPRMLWLTAHDIHPPLYYALLYGWIELLGGPEPLILRTFSMLVGFLSLPAFYWLAGVFFPLRRRLAVLAIILLLSSPIHIFYSQEVRMYGLATLLGMAATGCFWLLLNAHSAANRARNADPQILTQTARKRMARYWVAYLLFCTLSLYTLYYSALLLVAHLLWAIWHFRKRISACWSPVSALLLAGLLYAPWMIYTASQLQGYVSAKVAADNDTAIGLPRYLFQHMVAFTGGHLVSEEMTLVLLRYAGVMAILWLFGNMVYRFWRGTALQTQPSLPPRNAAIRSEQLFEQAAPGALCSFLIIPSAISFLINLFLPFAPEGGERLLLLVLPYFLLLIALGIERNWNWRLGIPALLLLLLSAAAGVFTFYTLPRYSQRDYRPIVGQMLQQGAENDTLLAIFPWQVGYWRAYSAQQLRTFGVTADEAYVAGPRPQLIGQTAVEWNAQVANQIRDALTRGTLWFPEPLSLGSRLPLQMEEYLWNQIGAVTPDGAIRGVNIENRWAGAATRLTAWRWLPQPALHLLDIRFGPLTLREAGVEPDRIESANRALAVRLLWHIEAGAMGHRFQASIRLQDRNGRVWASRDLPVASPGGLNALETLQPTSGEMEMLTGLLIPVGLPPGQYQVAIGISERTAELPMPPSGESTSLDPGEPFSTLPLLPAGTETPFVQLDSVQVETPAAPLPPFRLPIQHVLAPVAQRDGVAFLGYAGYDEMQSVLAGADFGMTLFLQNGLGGPGTNLPARILYVSLLDGKGAGVAGWDGWPLSDYPMTQWRAGALAQLPIQFALPATLNSGAYRVITGLLDPATGNKSAPVALGTVRIRQREPRFDAPTVMHSLSAPVQFGSHVELIGYDLARTSDAGQIELRLYWHVLQSLLPAHDVFVHLVDEQEQIVAQSDGPPRGVLSNGTTESAPTGSWLPNEYLTTSHVITLPSDFALQATTGELSIAGQRLELRVGLYVPQTGQRLPTTVSGQPTGDTARLP